MDLFASLVAGDLLVEARGTAARLHLDWTGRSNARHPSVMLAPYFEAVLTRAKQSGCSIEVHFERLEFLNSSTVAAVIKLINDARDQNVRMHLTFDGQQKWQSLNFEALRVFEEADGLLSIRPVPVVSH
jgi:hypothetical protein